MKNIASLLLSLALSLALLAGCTPRTTTAELAANPATSQGLNIVATVFPHYDFARAVAGSHAQITMLIRPGAESHSYEPTPSEIITIQNADVFIYTGGEGDDWVETILASIDTSKKYIVRMMDFVSLLAEEPVNSTDETEDGHGHDAENSSEVEPPKHPDTHIWTSPKNAILMVNALAKALASADATNAAAYLQNAQNYAEKLTTLDKDFRDITQNPTRNMLLFGDRFPFRYFAEEYGLSYTAAFPGCSTASEASAGTVAALINTVRQNRLPYIYIIELSNGTVANVIAEETGAEILQLHSCHNVTRDEFESGETYLSLMKSNLETLKKGLN